MSAKRETTVMKIYVGCALTEAPDEFKLEVETFKNALRKCGVEVLDFVGLTAGSALEVYNYDTHCTEDADLVIFICNYPSTGLGMEIMHRQHIGKPLICCAVGSGRVTRMVLGLMEHRKEDFLRFESWDALLAHVTTKHM